MTDSKNILLVEDDHSFRFAIASELRAEGYNVFTAEDGQRALNLVRNSSTRDLVDLVITDLVMPRVNGLAFIESLREEAFRGPVIIITGFLSDNLVKTANQLDVTGFLEKPFTFDEFLDKITGVLGENHRGGTG
jgi:DNA-binding response OmpR family regulator